SEATAFSIAAGGTPHTSTITFKPTSASNGQDFTGTMTVSATWTYPASLSGVSVSTGGSASVPVGLTGRTLCAPKYSNFRLIRNPPSGQALQTDSTFKYRLTADFRNQGCKKGNLDLTKDQYTTWTISSGHIFVYPCFHMTDKGEF